MGWMRNVLAAIGALAIVALLGLLVFRFVLPEICETTVIRTVTTDDQSVKATIYKRECGAMAATRVLVALSNSKVDGSKDGDVILTLVHVDDPSKTQLTWTTSRQLTVTYPASSEVEYSVTKTRGVLVEYSFK
jgi:hypothetical protein